MQPGRARRALIGVVVMAVLLATAPLAAVAAPSVARMLVALERDIGAAMAHAAVLRERLAAEPATGAVEPRPRGAADIAGIADGGSQSSLAALRLAARAVDRRLDMLRAAMPEQPSESAEVMLIMRSALGSVLWTIEDLPLATDEETAGVPTRRALLDRLDRSLADLATGTKAMAELAW